MLRRGAGPTGLLLALLAAAPQGDLSAQSRPFPNTLEIWVGANTWSGEEAEDFDWGWATGTTFLFDVGWPIQFGGDLSFSQFGGPEILPEIDEFTGSVALRYRFQPSPSIFPFLSARAGYTRLSAEFEPYRLEQNGALVGGGAGLEVPLSGQIMLALSTEALYQRYGAARVFQDDIDLPTDDGGGAWRYWARLGLSWRWGRWFQPE
jgi:hypothetical protein